MVLGSLMIISYYLILSLTINYGFILLANFCLGLGLTFISGSTESYIYENTSEYEKVLRISMLIGNLSIGFAILIGGIVSTFSWTLVFSMALAVQLVVLVNIMFLPKDEVVVKDETLKQNIIKLKELYLEIFKSNHKWALVTFLIIDSFFWFYYMIEQVNFSFLSVGNQSIGFIYFVISVILMVIIKYDLSDRLGNLLLYIMLIVSGFIVITATSIPFIEIIMLFVSQVYVFVFFPRLSNKVHDLLDNEHRNQLISILYSVSSILMLILFGIFILLTTIVSSLVATYLMFFIVIIMYLVVQGKYHVEKI